MERNLKLRTQAEIYANNSHISDDEYEAYCEEIAFKAGGTYALNVLLDLIPEEWKTGKKELYDADEIIAKIYREIEHLLEE